LDKILTPDQLSNLPDTDMFRGGNTARRVAVFGDGTGDHMMISDDIDLDDEGAPPEGGTMIIRTVTVPATGGGHGGGDGGSGGEQPRPTTAPKP